MIRDTPDVCFSLYVTFQAILGMSEVYCTRTYRYSLSGACKNWLSDWSEPEYARMGSDNNNAYIFQP